MSRARRAALALVWAGAVLFGARFLAGYSYTPGPAAEAPSAWPAASRLRPAADRSTLLLFAHPGCPCTRASLAELERLLPRLGGRVEAHVLLVAGAGRAAAEAERGPLAARAATIAGVTVRVDGGGREADLFGARTSGQVVLYDRGRRLAFAGGITSSRGHEGRNVGSDRIVTLVSGREPERREGNVYGCGLRGGSPRAAQGG